MRTIRYKNILVPFDFGESYRYAFQAAEEIALRSDACITLVHVCNPVALYVPEPAARFGFATIPNLPDEQEKELLLREFANNSALPENKIKIIVSSGDWNREIIKLCSELYIDLVLVPDFEKTTLDRLLSDINPPLLIEKTKVPVISVNCALKNFKINKIVMPIRDVKNWFDKIPFTVDLARLTGAKIYVFGLCESNAESACAVILDKIARCREYLQLNYYNFVIENIRDNKDTDLEALKFAESKNADLIAVTPPHSFFKLRSYFSKEFYNRIISKGKVPVFTVTCA